MKPPQSLAGYIRQHLKELEERLEVGVRQEVIVAELEAHGYKTTLKGFRNFLYRARIRATKKAVAAPTKPVPQKEPEHAPQVAQNEAEKEDESTTTIGSHRPTDLDAIHDQEVDLRSLAKLAKRKKQ